MRKKAGMPFKDLPVPYQTVVVIWNLENEEYLDTLPEDLDTRSIKWENPDDPDVRLMLSRFKDYLETRPDPEPEFLYGILPITEICEKVMVSKPWDLETFEDYHREYMIGLEEREYGTILPVIADHEEPDFILDGWHRFHGYYAQGIKEVPVLFVD